KPGCSRMKAARCCRCCSIIPFLRATISSVKPLRGDLRRTGAHDYCRLIRTASARLLLWLPTCSCMCRSVAIALSGTRSLVDAKRLLEQGGMMGAQPVEDAVLQFFGQVAQFLDLRVAGNTGGFVDAPAPLG